MSTRANIIIKDSTDKLFFYRHSDGYPEGVLPTLNLFLKLVKDGKLRNNVLQSAGWLIIIGAIEYQTVDPSLFSHKDEKYLPLGVPGHEEKLNPADWKVGSYEPTTGIHGDIEYLYTVDLDKLTITTKAI